MAAVLAWPLLVATIRWGSVGPLLVTALAIMGSPGPATISLTAATSAYGLRRSVGYMLGIIVGTTVVLVAVATGITATILAVPALRAVLLGISAAYLLWLASRIATAPAPAAAQTPAAPSLAGGTLLGVANPKAWVAITAVFASARLADTAMTDAAAKLVALSVMIVLIMGAWLVVGAFLAARLRHPVRARIVNIALAVALVGATALAILR
jgi:threonine/homoserine/homoserine lactone efflux protein